MSDTYSQKELLLLSNFVYIPACVSTEKVSTILDEYRDADGSFSEEGVALAAAGGGMSVSDVRTVFTAMDEHIRENPSFGELSAARCLNDKDVRAVCYTNDKDKDPVVVFRGTGGTENAWTDNFEGAYLEDTKIQKIADDFVRHECGIYEDVTVTGHSKGGNLAMYVTVKEQEKVISCLSFDGQGFGNEFIDNNGSSVDTAAPKITSISAYNDFVNILLTCIAGTSIYVANEGSAEGAHSPVALLTNNTFDENGNFTSIRSQGPVAKELDSLTDVIVSALSPASEKDKEDLSAIAGSAIALALTTPSGRIAEDCVAPTLGTLGAKLAAKITREVEADLPEDVLCAKSLYADTDDIRRCASALSDASASLQNIRVRVDHVRSGMKCTMNTHIIAESKLIVIEDEITMISRQLGFLSDMTCRVADSYEKAEEDVLTLVRF